MTAIIRSLDEAAEIAAEELGIAAGGFALASPEGLAASARRAASFLCPATQRQLVDAVIEVLQPLLASDELQRNRVNTVVEALVLLFMTQDFIATMTLIDNWTVVFALILFVQLLTPMVAAVIHNSRNQNTRSTQTRADDPNRRVTL